MGPVFFQVHSYFTAAQLAGGIQDGQLEGVDPKIGRKWANFPRFSPILEGQATLLDPPLAWVLIYRSYLLQHTAPQVYIVSFAMQ